MRSPGSSSTLRLQSGARVQARSGLSRKLPPRSSDAGWSRPALRPRNSRRSPVQEVWRPPRSAKATRSANSPFQAFRANMAPVAGSISVTTKGCGAAPLDPQHPLRIRRDREPPFAAGPILQGEAGDLDRVPRRHELQEIQCDAVGCVLEATVPLAVPDDIGPGFFADGEHGRSPDETAVLIPNIERLARRVADGIVRPRRELVLPAVHRPCKARARLGGLETEVRVGHHVDPGGRGPLPRAQSRDVFAAVRA